MRIGATSDLHGVLPAVEECDIFLICGDIMPLNIQLNMPKSRLWLQNTFIPRANGLPCKHVVFIAGNHDFWFERNGGLEPDMYNMFHKPTDGKLVYLHNKSWEYEHEIEPGVFKKFKIFGTPYCKQFGNWAFMREPERLEAKYTHMPSDCDILISHDAPRLLGLGEIHEGAWAGKDAGNTWLADEIMRKQPKHCFCGHIHSGCHGIQEFNGMKFSNVSLVNEDYVVSYKPLYLNV